MLPVVPSSVSTPGKLCLVMPHHQHKGAQGQGQHFPYSLCSLALLQQPALLLAPGHLGAHILMPAWAQVPAWPGSVQQSSDPSWLLSAWNPWCDGLPSEPQSHREVSCALGESFWNHSSKSSLRTHPPCPGILLQQGPYPNSLRALPRVCPSHSHLGRSSAHPQSCHCCTGWGQRVSWVRGSWQWS